MKKKIAIWVASTIAILALIRLFFVIPVTVYGYSMMPTISDQDHVLGMKIGSIKRFDIITFYVPEDDEDYIKRVIGLPGDTVEYREDELYVNGELLDEPYLKEQKELLIGDERLTENLYITVPKGEYFVLGDNRHESVDSREIGTISSKNFVANVKFSYWPINHIGTID